MSGLPIGRFFTLTQEEPPDGPTTKHWAHDRDWDQAAQGQRWAMDLMVMSSDLFWTRG